MKENAVDNTVLLQSILDVVGINEKTVWSVVNDNLPQLQKYIETIIRKEEGN